MTAAERERVQAVASDLRTLAKMVSDHSITPEAVSLRAKRYAQDLEDLVR